MTHDPPSPACAVTSIMLELVAEALVADRGDFVLVA